MSARDSLVVRYVAAMFLVQAAAWLPPPAVLATHRLGSVLDRTPPVVIGPDSGGMATAPGEWAATIADADPISKYLILHFSISALEGGDRVEVALGYDVDEFTAASGSEVWTRPVAGGSVTVTYFDDGDGVGGVTCDRYGRGEEIDVFLLSSPFVDPATWNASGVCPNGAAPSWENVDCLPVGLKKTTAESVGMFISASATKLSSCSAALIDADLILTAGHCIDTEAEALSASFTLDFRTNCDGSAPPGYSPFFHKVMRVVETGCVPAPGTTCVGLDYSILQIDTGGSGAGAPPVPIRPDSPAIGEELFVVHHPRGATKKISRQPTDPDCEVLAGADLNELRYACDSDNGSSGSPVFDATGAIVAVNDWAPGACNNQGQASTAILDDILTLPPPPQDADVVMVFDRSGSMSLTGTSGATKIEEAKDAAALFVDLLQTTASHQAGLVSFSTIASLDFALSPVNDVNKLALIGPPPLRNAGFVGGLMPGGATTIGGGIENALAEFPPPAPGGNQPVILLMTDGLQNTAPFIADVEPTLGSTHLCIIGFGTEASLDGPLLTRLARDHGGIYTRAGEGLELKKFFVLCFGNIFHAGISMDPFYTIPPAEVAADPIPFQVCGETSLTVVLGWERPRAGLRLELVTPGGSTISAVTPGVAASSGSTWKFLRLPFPFAGERDGTWQAAVSRPEGTPAGLEERFFVTVVIDGGPVFRPFRISRAYTGDALNPLVQLADPSRTLIPAEVKVDVTRPGQGTGNLLVANGLGPPSSAGGDGFDARTSTLLALEKEAGGLLIPAITETFSLFDDSEHGDRGLEEDGIFGNPLEGITRFEGNYTFRAVATFGSSCTSTRETTWTLHVALGIDADQTEAVATATGSLPDGRTLVRIRFTPRDSFGSYLGPGRADAFAVEGAAGTEVIGQVSDLGDGSYAVEVATDPDPGSPGIAIVQPGRTPVVITPAPGFVRGDSNADDRVNIADPVFTLNRLFRGGPQILCLDSADANDQDGLNISDPVYLINYLFRGGPRPPEPFPGCGLDTTDDDLGCGRFPPCEG